MHTDPVGDMLTRIRNGSRARLERVDVPRSDLKVRIIEILKREGFIADYREVKAKPASVIEVYLRYDKNREPVISGLRRTSSPGKRTYTRSTDIPRVRDGLGTLILTTSKGLLTDREARKAGVGGEVLCSVW